MPETLSQLGVRRDAASQIRGAERILWGVSLILAPGLFASSTFFWIAADGRVEYGATGGSIIALATVFWIPAFAGLFQLLKARMPRYATWGWLVALYGCVGGMAFGLEGLFAEAFSISHDARASAWAQYPIVFNLTFFWPGPLFPLSMLILGAMLMRTRSIPIWAGILLCLGSIAFPLSRIPRLNVIAHAADFLMLVPLAYIGFTYLTSRKAPDVGR